MLTHERLFRDLHEAERTNVVANRLRLLVERNELSAAQLDTVLRELGVKPIELVVIRPATDLPGNPFSGFVDRDLREGCVRAGADVAHAVLPSLSPSSRGGPKPSRVCAC